MENNSDEARGQEIASALTRRKVYTPKRSIGVIDISSIDPESGVVAGIDCQSGEPVRVRLAKDSHEHSPTVKDMAGLTKAPLLRVAVGGSIRADGASEGADGVYDANFFAIGNPSGGSGRMYEAHIRVNPTYRTAERSSKAVDVITQSPITPKTKADLLLVLTESAARGNGVLIRSIIGEQVRTLSINARYEEGVSTFNGSEAYEQFLGEVISKIPEDIELKHIGVIEVIPYTRLFIPPQTLAAMEKNNKLSRIDALHLKSPQSEGKLPSSKGFVHAIVTEVHFGDSGVGIKDFGLATSSSRFSRFGPGSEQFEEVSARKALDRASRELSTPARPKAPGM